MSCMSVIPFVTFGLGLADTRSEFGDLRFATQKQLREIGKMSNPGTVYTEPGANSLQDGMLSESRLSRQSSVIGPTGGGLRMSSSTLQHQASSFNVLATGRNSEIRLSRGPPQERVGPRRGSASSRQGGFASGLLPSDWPGKRDATRRSRSLTPGEEPDTLIAQTSASGILDRPISARKPGAIKVGDDGIPEHLALAEAEMESAAEKQMLSAALRMRTTQSQSQSRRNSVSSRRGSVLPSRESAASSAGVGRKLDQISEKQTAQHSRPVFEGRSGSLGRGVDPGTYNPWPLMWPNKEVIQARRRTAGRQDMSDDWAMYKSGRFEGQSKNPLGPVTYSPEHRGTRDQHTPNGSAVVLQSRVGRFPKLCRGIDNDDVAPGTYSVDLVPVERGYRPWVLQIGGQLGRTFEKCRALPWAAPMQVVRSLSDDKEDPVLFAHSRKRLMSERIRREEVVTAATSGVSGGASEVPKTNEAPKPAHPFSEIYLRAPVLI